MVLLTLKESVSEMLYEMTRGGGSGQKPYLRLTLALQTEIRTSVLPYSWSFIEIWEVGWSLMLACHRFVLEPPVENTAPGNAKNSNKNILTSYHLQCFAWDIKKYRFFILRYLKFWKVHELREVTSALYIKNIFKSFGKWTCILCCDFCLIFAHYRPYFDSIPAQ